MCPTCSVSKSHKIPFTDSSFQATSPLDLICSDVWGPTLVISNDGYKYYVIFFDHYSKYTWIYFLKFKYEVLSIFNQFQKILERYIGCSIRSFQPDRGGEFQDLTSYLRDNGITQCSSCPYTPE